MTVKELIKQLQEMEQDREVICVDDDENEYEVTDIFSYIPDPKNQTIICITRN